MTGDQYAVPCDKGLHRRLSNSLQSCLIEAPTEVWLLTSETTELFWVRDCVSRGWQVSWQLLWYRYPAFIITLIFIAIKLQGHYLMWGSCKAQSEHLTWSWCHNANEILLSPKQLRNMDTMLWAAWMCSLRSWCHYVSKCFRPTRGLA